MHVCSDKTGQADLDSIPASGEQKLHEQQAPGHQLSWDREDIEMSILAALILRGCIAHANQESLKVTASTSKDLVQGLVRKSVTKLKGCKAIRSWYDWHGVWIVCKKMCESM